MKEFFRNNKTYIAILIAAFIIGGFIYLSRQGIVGQSTEWTLFKQSAPYQPFYKFSGIPLNRCYELGLNWLQRPENIEGEYSCCRGCKLNADTGFLECGECYVYNRAGLRFHDKTFIPFAEIRISE